VSVLGGGIDELDVELFGLPGLHDGEQSLSDDNRSLAGSDDSTLDEEEIFLDFTVVGESTHGGNVLLNGISFAGGVVGNVTDLTGTDSVDLLVHLSSVMVAHLTSSGDCPFDSSGMPSSDTSDLAETSVRFTVESLDTESLDDTLHTVTLGNTVDIDDFVHVEDITDGNLLLEETSGVGNLIGDVSTVDLDFHNVSLVLSESELSDLSGGEDTDDRAVFVDTVNVTLDGFLVILGELVAVVVLGESLFLGVHPVLVHSTLDIVGLILSPDGTESAEATGGLDVADITDNFHWGAFDARDGVDDILLEHLLTLTTFLVLNDVSHTSFVSHEGGEMRLVSRVVTGE
jgi:hypothetical protein